MGKNSVVSNVSFFIKRPGKVRRSFSVIRRLTFTDGAKTHSTIKDPHLALINKHFRVGRATFSECDDLAVEIRDRFKDMERLKLGSLEISLDNQIVLNRYWNERYAHRFNKCMKSSRYRLARSVRALGAVSIRYGSIEQIQKIISKQNNQRDVASALNEILIWLGRPIRLARHRKVRLPVRHIGLEDLKPLLSSISDQTMVDLVATGFATGGRLGECFAITEGSIAPNGEFVTIASQLKEDGSYDSTKRSNCRRSPIVPELRDHVRRWARVSEEERLLLRRSNLAKNICSMLQKLKIAESKSEIKYFRDLRHCYAIHLLSKDASIDMVARALGNSVPVCEEYYAGYVLHDVQLEKLTELLEVA